MSISLLTLLPAPAGAQLLNLDSPGAPAAGEGKAALALVAQIETSITELQARAASPSGPAGATARIKLGLRRLAQALVQTGETAGEHGSPHILAGRTLFSRIDEADRLVDSIAAAHPGDVDTIASQLERDLGAAGSPQVGGAGAGSEGGVPIDPRALDRFLRDALAILAEFAATDPAQQGAEWRTDPSRVGWVEAIGSPAPAAPAATPMCDHLARWVAAGLPQETAAQLAEADAVLHLAEQWWAYKAGALELRRVVIAAGDTAFAAPEWLTPDLRQKLAAEFQECTPLLADESPVARDAASARLGVLAIAGRAVRLLDDEPLRGKPQQAARDACAKAIAGAIEPPAPPPEGMPPRSPSPRPDSRLRTVVQVFELIHRRDSLGDESSIAREARPAWRVLDARTHETRQDLLTLLARVADTQASTDPASDPAVITAIGAQRQALDDLRAVQSASRWLEETRRTGGPVHNKGAAQILRISQGFLKPATLDFSLDKMRSLGADLESLLVFPGEADLRAPAPEYKPLTGDRAAELVTLIDAARDEWLKAWTDQPDKPEPIHAAASRLRVMRRLAGALADGVTLGRVLQDPGASSIQAWPGWELSPQALAAAASGLPDRLAAATADVLDQGDDKGQSTRALDEVESRFALARLVAALERAAKARGILRAPVLIELAATPPPGDDSRWLIPLRPRLAAICRYQEEYAAQNDPKLLTYINSLATDALNELHHRDSENTEKTGPK